MFFSQCFREQFSKPTENVPKLRINNHITFITSLFIVTLSSIHPIIASDPLLKEIRFIKTSANEERVFFILNGFYPPKIFALKGERPRVVCDFFNMRLKNDLNRLIETNGDLIQCIRVGIHSSPDPRIRVVSDLVPNQSYDVQQIFFRKDNTFLIIVRLAETRSEK